MATFYFMKSDEIATYPLANGTLASVSSSGVDTDYSVQSLCYGWPGTPVRWTSGAASGTITLPAAATISMVVVSHHKLDAAKAVTFSSGITAVVTTPATTPPDGIPLNPFTTITPAAGVTAFNFAITGNSTDVIIGEIIAGAYRSLTLPLAKDDQRGLEDFSRQWNVAQSAVAPYRSGLASRAPWRGRYMLTSAERDLVDAWFLSQCEGTRPSVVVPDPSVNEAIVGFLQKPSYSVAGPRHWNVELTFVEFPRSRW